MRISARLLIVTLVGLTAGCAGMPAYESPDWVQAFSTTRTGRSAVALDRSPSIPSTPEGASARLVRVQASDQLGLCVQIHAAQRGFSPVATARDTLGRDFDVVEIGRKHLGDGRWRQTVCASLDEGYLQAHAELGFGMQFIGERGEIEIAVPAEWIAGFTAYVTDAEMTSEQLALK